MKGILPIILFFIIPEVPAQVNRNIIDTFQLKTLTQKNVSLKSFNNLYTVFIFLSPDCPLSQKYTLPLQLIYNKYKQNVDFIGIFPGKWYTDNEYKKFKKIYNPPYLLVKDEKLKLTNYLGATVTPEVYLVDKNGKTLYHGAIDDWVVSLGRIRNSTTTHYLSEAISQALSQHPINPDFIKPTGCFIEK